MLKEIVTRFFYINNNATTVKYFSFAVLSSWLLLLLIISLAPSKIIDTIFLEQFILCPFRFLTGVECPGCGVTRSFLSLGLGDLSMASYFNPFGPILFYYFLYQISPIKIKTEFLTNKGRRVISILSLSFILLWWVLFRLFV